MKKAFKLNKVKRLLIKRAVAVLAVIGVVMFGWPVQPALAGNITSAKDTMSTIATSALGTHAFSFTTATSLTATQTIKVQFDAAGDAFTLDGTIAATDFSNESGLDVVAACGAGGNEVTVTVDNTAPDEHYLFTVCSGDTVAAGAITFTIDGDEITNPSGANTYVITITTTSDSGSIAVPIIADDSVSVTATVDPTITFTINDTAVGFGPLSATEECWAQATPPASCNSTQSSAHTLAVATNAANGWAITYNGATLTSGGNTIDVADINGDPDGTPGTEQFAIGASTNGDATIATDYQQASNNFRFIAGTTTQLVSESVPTATETLSMYYIANIAGNTEAGNYSTSITYIATATF